MLRFWRKLWVDNCVSCVKVNGIGYLGINGRLIDGLQMGMFNRGVLLHFRIGQVRVSVLYSVLYAIVILFLLIIFFGLFCLSFWERYITIRPSVNVLEFLIR